MDCGSRQPRHGPAAPFGGEVPGSRAGVVAGGDGGVGQLLEGVGSGLARFPLDEVEERGAQPPDEVVESE